MTWTREHDRVIAERCEGLHLMDPTHVEHRERGGEAGWHDRVPLDRYNKNIIACIRAAEAWRSEMPDHRGFWVGIDHCHDAGPEAEVRDCSGEKDRKAWGQGVSFSAALAEALYKAVTA